jgi:ABC-type transport system involved in multi-copper enzyme maturation permease subunit
MKQNTTLSKVLTPIAFLLVWVVLFGVGLLALIRFGNRQNILAVYYDNVSAITTTFFVIGGALVLMGVWFAGRFFRE